MSPVILQCILPVCGVPGVDMEAVCTEHSRREERLIAGGVRS
jgi:hypothetical protein